MGYIRFEKGLMTNLEETLPKELLRTNRSGAYSCSSILDCNTRKYHGLLVVPIPEIDDENHVLLSSLDVSVIQHGAEFIKMVLMGEVKLFVPSKPLISLVIVPSLQAKNIKLRPWL